jgi:hypothetical protein
MLHLVSIWFLSSIYIVRLEKPTVFNWALLILWGISGLALAGWLLS